MREPPVDIASMREDDLPALVAMCGPERAAGREHYFRNRLARQRQGVGDILVAWCDGRPVGDVHLIREPVPEPEIREKLADVPQVSHLEVVPAYRRRGVGSALLDAVERLAFEHGHTMVCLGVGVDNAAASALYRGRGYDDWGHGTVVFRWESPLPTGGFGEEHEDCRVLLKIVDPSMPGLDDWDAWHPSDLAAIVGAACPVDWYVAAGWAIDLHLGRQTRAHEDLEVAIRRTDFDAWRNVLAGFDLYDVGDGRLRRLAPGEQPQPTHYQMWVCDPAVPAWRMDTFLQDSDPHTWAFHRDPRVRAPQREAVARTADGIPYLLPQYVLLAKAKHQRPKDEADFAVVLPRLEPAARTWLAEALDLVHPGHAWIAPLRR